jgi:hypothetical protein
VSGRRVIVPPVHLLLWFVISVQVGVFLDYGGWMYVLAFLWMAAMGYDVWIHIERAAAREEKP